MRLLSIDELLTFYELQVILTMVGYPSTRNSAARDARICGKGHEQWPNLLTKLLKLNRLQVFSVTLVKTVGGGSGSSYNFHRSGAIGCGDTGGSQTITYRVSSNTIIYDVSSVVGVRPFSPTLSSSTSVANYHCNHHYSKISVGKRQQYAIVNGFEYPILIP
ncbi:Hypothetical predicted protein [Octopus vulgaris]|uniref:Uncharacterized protein n=1 Tax=Octopus vulgaris TaxID=6645 RepID=A0AA36AS73_OCTVU|nr:Hypothetical predicted protein [Octopus vulgaris]